MASNVKWLTLAWHVFSLKMPHLGTRSKPTICGTPGYVAPEILCRVPYSYAVDSWSLGVITYIVACGFPPFALNMQPETVQKVKTADFGFPQRYWNYKSDVLKDFIRKMIVEDPCQRMTVDEALAHPWLACCSEPP